MSSAGDVLWLNAAWRIVVHATNTEDLIDTEPLGEWTARQLRAEGWTREP